MPIRWMPTRLELGPRTYSRRGAMLALGAFAAGATFATNAVAAPGENRREQGDSGDEARADAMRALPLDDLNREGRAKVEDVLAKTSLFRRLPAQTVDCDGEMHLFLVRHPEVVVNIWKLMGITGVTVKRIDEFVLDAADGGGTHSRVELLYGTPETNLYYCSGWYEGPLFKQKMHGRAVLLARHQYAKARGGRPTVVCGMDIFMAIDHLGAELIAKTLHVSVGRTVDGNFAESCKFAGKLSQAAEQKTENVEQLATKLDQCTPEIRERFAQIARRVASRAISQTDATPAGYEDELSATEGNPRR